MTALEDSFAKLLGEQATEEQKQRLYQVRDALGLANNDALWLVLLALEHYDGRFRRYPEQLAADALRVLEAQRLALAQTVAAEAAKGHRSLARAVVATAQELAGRAADAARWRAWALVAAGMVLFGALCMTGGYVLGSGRPPPWAILEHAGPLSSVLAGLLRAPAGWTFFGLLAPVAVYYAWAGWSLLKVGEGARGARATGAGLLVASVAGLLTCAVVLGKVMGL